MATKKASKPQKPRTYTFVIAPDIPSTEVKHLEAHWKESQKDPSYTVITNYEVAVTVVTVNPGEALVVNAPQIPVTELKALRKKIDRKLRNNLIVVNYDLAAYTVPQEQ